MLANQDVIIQNMIRLADHHRRNCDGPSCNISLSFLLDLFAAAGINLTAEQTRHFL